MRPIYALAITAGRGIATIVAVTASYAAIRYTCASTAGTPSRRMYRV